MDAILNFFSSLPGELYVFLISMLPIVELRGAIPIGASSLVGLPFYSNYLIAVVGNLLPVPFILFFVSKFLNFLSRFKFFRPMVNWLRRKADKHSAKVIKTDTASAEEAQDKTETKNSIETAAVTESADANPVQGSANCIPAEETAAEKIAAEKIAAEAAPADSISEQPATSTKKPKAKMTLAMFFGLMLFVAIPLPATGAWTGALIAALFNFPKKRSLLAITLGVLVSGVIMSLASYGVIGFLNILT